MKKRMLIAFCCGLFLLTGCKDQGTSEQAGEPSIQEGQLSEQMDDADSDEKETNEEQSSETESNHKIKIYYVDPDTAEITSRVEEFSEVDAERIWMAFQQDGLVPETCKINSFQEVDEQKIEMDVTADFGEKLRSMGTTGEEEIMHCVVNTYLEAYNCDEIKITEDGQTLYSNNREYEGYLTKYE